MIQLGLIETSKCAAYYFQVGFPLSLSFQVGFLFPFKFCGISSLLSCRIPLRFLSLPGADHVGFLSLPGADHPVCHNTEGTNLTHPRTEMVVGVLEAQVYIQGDLKYMQGITYPDWWYSARFKTGGYARGCHWFPRLLT
jgi:hypothetical protein